MKKKLFYSITLLVMIIFVVVPLPSANLYIRIYFDEVDFKITGNNCILYYATDTDPVFSQKNYLSSEINHDEHMVEFCLDSSLENHITGLRLDFPGIQQVVCVKGVTVSSAGVIKRQYNPCDFFSEGNVIYANDTYAIDRAVAGQRVFIGTLSENPFVVLSDELCRQIASCYSHFWLTRLAICLFLAGCYFFARLKIFPENPR